MNGYGQKEEPVKAMIYGQKALQLAHMMQKPDTPLLITTYNGIAALSLRMGDTAEASRNWSNSERFIRAIKDTNALSSLYINKATMLIEKRDFRQAFIDISYIKKISESRKDSSRIAKTGYQLSLLKVREQQPEEALKYLDQTAAIASKLPLHMQEKGTELWLRAESYLLLGDTKKAEHYYLKAIDFGYQQKITDYRLPALQQALGDLYAITGAYKKAYLLNKAGIERFLNQLNEQASKEYSDLAVKYELAKKDKILAQKNLKISEQKNKLQRRQLPLIILLCIIMLIITGFLIFYIYKRKGQQFKALKERIDGIEEERGRLSRELHDGVISELSAILMKLKTSTSDSTQSYNTLSILQELEKSITDLRNTSHNLLPDIIAQAGLIDAIRYFCKRISQAGVFEVTVLSHGSLPSLAPSFQLNIYRILQELLSNIHKHSNAGKVLLQFNVTSSQLYITIEDNSSATEIKTARTGEGIGNMNINSRLNATKGNWEFRPSMEGLCIYLDFELAPHKLNIDYADQDIHS